MVDHRRMRIADAPTQAPPFRHCPAARQRTLVNALLRSVKDTPSGSAGRSNQDPPGGGRKRDRAARCCRSSAIGHHAGSSTTPWPALASPSCAPPPAQPSATRGQAATFVQCAPAAHRCSSADPRAAPRQEARVVQLADTPTLSPSHSRQPTRSIPAHHRRPRARRGPRTRRRALTDARKARAGQCCGED
jgi:hypothetical protein